MRIGNSIVVLGAFLALGAGLATTATAEPPSGPQALQEGPDPLCPVLTSLMTSASHGFVTLRGAAKQDVKSTWEASVTVPDGKECLVFGGPPPAYSCTLYAGDDPPAAEGAYKDMIERVQKCLGDKWTTEEKGDVADKKATVVSGPGAASVRILSRAAQGDAYVVELWLDARRK